MNRFAIQQHFAGFGLQQPRQPPQQGGFAAAVWPHQRRNLAGGDGQAELLDNRFAVVS